MTRNITLTINGKKRSDTVEPRMLLIHYLREVAGLTGPHIACETSLCGACTVHVDGKAVKSCTMFAVQADGREVLTIEGLASDGKLDPMQEAFWNEHALQCGFCTPGMIMTAKQIVERNPQADRRGDPPRPGRQSLPLHRLPAHRQRGEGGRGESVSEGHHGYHHHQDRNTGWQAHSTARRSASDHRHSDLRRRHSDAWHASRLHRAQPARRSEDQVDRYQTGARAARRGRRCSLEKTPRSCAPVPCGASLPGLRVPHHHLLAIDRVYLVGHPVAVVVATDRYIARDAAELVEVEYEPLPAVTDPEKALEPGAPAVHPQWPDNTAFTFHQEGGDVDKAFAEAEVVVKQRITSQRLIPTAMETRGCVADWRVGRQIADHPPHHADARTWLRTLLAAMLGLPENHMRVVTPEIGGGFGSKIQVYAEEALMGFVAMKIGKPIKWIESRRENFTGTIHGRGHVDYYEVAAKRDGTILGIKLKLIQDLGAFHQLLTPAIPTLSVLMMPGLYKCQNIRADIVGVFTNCMATDAYRGAGRPEATHGIERMVDILAAELKMDPAEIRFKNFIGKDEFPYATATGLSYDSGNYAAPLEKALDIAGYKKLREEQKKARARGPPDRHRHVGLWRDLRLRAFARHARRWMGERHGKDRAGRHGHGDDRLLAAWPGRGDHLRSDRRRRAGRGHRRRAGAARRHRHRAVRHRHIWQPRHRHRRHRPSISPSRSSRKKSKSTARCCSKPKTCRTPTARASTTRPASRCRWLRSPRLPTGP